MPVDFRFIVFRLVTIFKKTQSKISALLRLLLSSRVRNRMGLLTDPRNKTGCVDAKETISHLTGSLISARYTVIDCWNAE